MAVEEARFAVLEQDGRFQVRAYEAHVVAEVRVAGGLEQAGTRGFGPLFRFISGRNRDGAKIAMTAPVVQRADADAWAVGFVMPAATSLETLPAPTERDVRLRAEPARRMAAIRYSGRWTAERYQRHLQELRDWISARRLVEAGPPVWARYNPPFMPAFLRRNEVLIPLAAPATPADVGIAPAE